MFNSWLKWESPLSIARNMRNKNLQIKILFLIKREPVPKFTLPKSKVFFQLWNISDLESIQKEHQRIDIYYVNETNTKELTSRLLDLDWPAPRHHCNIAKQDIDETINYGLSAHIHRNRSLGVEIDDTKASLLTWGFEGIL